MTTSERDVVAALGPAVARRIGEPRYQLWFDGKTKFNLEGECLVVGVRNCFYQEWLDHAFRDAVRAAADEVVGRPLEVRFRIDAELFRAAREAENQAPVSPAPPLEPSPPVPLGPARLQTRARRFHRLEEFVVGPGTRLAHAAALRVVEEPGEAINPLVLYGSVGTGKTHLLEGIYSGLRQVSPDVQVRYVTAEEFTNRFVQAMHQGKMAGFRQQFRECDALLLDDLQFLAGKAKTEEEFLHTFDSLRLAGKQVVVALDVHPRLAEELSPELMDRLLGGAVWGLTVPDEHTRLQILRTKEPGPLPRVPGDVLRYLAEQVKGNVRELEGALHSIRHAARVTERPISLELAREVLGELLRHTVRVVQLADIVRAVCQVLRLESGTLQSKQRGRAVSHPRMLALYLARKHTQLSCSDIGRQLGSRNHSTVLAAEKKVRHWLQENSELVLGECRGRLRDVIERIERELQR